MSAQNRARAVACFRLASDATVALAQWQGPTDHAEYVKLRQRRDEMVEEAVDELLVAAEDGGKR